MLPSLGQNSLFSSSFFPFTSILLSFCFPLSLSIITYQFLLLFLPFPLFFVPFSALPVLLWQFSSCPSLPRFSTEWLHSPLWISVILNCSLFSSPSSLRFFFCPSVRIIIFLGSPALHGAIYHGVALDYGFYTLLFIVLFCYLLQGVLIFAHCSLFYSSIYFLSHLSLPFTPQFSPVYHGSARGIFTKLIKRWGTTSPLLFFLF